jgi:hypothetical protein
MMHTSVVVFVVDRKLDWRLVGQALPTGSAVVAMADHHNWHAHNVCNVSQHQVAELGERVSGYACSLLPDTTLAAWQEYDGDLVVEVYQRARDQYLVRELWVDMTKYFVLSEDELRARYGDVN